MDTYYLVDFENVHNEGVANIKTLTSNDHVHIFYTVNALNCSMDATLAKGIDIVGHKVADGAQSLDKHLLSFLGLLLGEKGKNCSYIIVAIDKGYDNIIEFLKEQGYPNIKKIPKIPAPKTSKQPEKKKPKQVVSLQNQNAIINKCLEGIVSGEDRSELNNFVQRSLKSMNYKGQSISKISSIVVQNCNTDQKLKSIHNALNSEYSNTLEIFNDLKMILEEFSTFQTSKEKKVSHICSFYEQHFKKKIYLENKDDTIALLINATSIKEVNTGLQKIYRDSQFVKNMLNNLRPLLDDIL